MLYCGNRWRVSPFWLPGSRSWWTRALHLWPSWSPLGVAARGLHRFRSHQKRSALFCTSSGTFQYKHLYNYSTYIFLFTAPVSNLENGLYLYFCCRFASFLSSRLHVYWVCCYMEYNGNHPIRWDLSTKLQELDEAALEAQRQQKARPWDRWDFFTLSCRALSIYDIRSPGWCHVVLSSYMRGYSLIFSVAVYRVLSQFYSLSWVAFQGRKVCLWSLCRVSAGLSTWFCLTVHRRTLVQVRNVGMSECWNVNVKNWWTFGMPWRTRVLSVLSVPLYPKCTAHEAFEEKLIEEEAN